MTQEPASRLGSLRDGFTETDFAAVFLCQRVQAAPAPPFSAVGRAPLTYT